MKKIESPPSISVVIPVYNLENFIKETLDSIKNQSFADFEAIIVNNGSTEKTLSILKNYQKNDKRFIIKNLKEANAVKAANFGLTFARGKYIVKMDGDDLCLPDKFKIQFNYLEQHPDIFLVGNSAIIINERGERIGVFRKYNNPEKINKKLMKSNPFIHSSIMYRNEKGLFYREKFAISEEYDMYLRLLSEGKKLTNLPNLLTKYRIRGNSLVSTKTNQAFYFSKAKEFYMQRKKYGKDDYENLKPPIGKQEQKQIPFDKMNLQVVILAELQDNQSSKVRKNISLYSQKYGMNKKMAIYYILSFLPGGFIRFIQKNLF
jgi:glycosyltransferase involved in cell wall biosynthesis